MNRILRYYAVAAVFGWFAGWLVSWWRHSKPQPWPEPWTSESLLDRHLDY